MKEQRVHFRMDLQAEAAVADVMGEVWHAVTPLNISVRGIAFTIAEQLPAEALRRFRFYLPDNPKVINLVLKIGYSRNHAYLSGFRTGATFATVKEGDLALIRQFVSDHTLPGKPFAAVASLTS